jgi:hypothetical protein
MIFFLMVILKGSWLQVPGAILGLKHQCKSLYSKYAAEENCLWTIL